MLMFNETYASEYGLKESIILHKVIFYVLINKKDGRNLHKGRHWTFNSREGWRSVFPCFSDMQIWRSLKNLEKHEALLSDSFNRRAYDKTRWYTLSDKLTIEVSKSSYWSKAICKSVKSYNKIEKTDNKIATPIPLDNNIIQEIKPY